VTLGGTRPAHASGTPTWSTDQLATFADIVVVARVDELSSGWDAQSHSLYTYVSVSVERVLKGEVPGGRLVVKQLGGRLQNIGLHVADQPDFELGESVLLFLEVRPRDATLYTTALWQGKWTLERDGRGERVATRRGPVHGRDRRVERQALAAVERSVSVAPRKKRERIVYDTTAAAAPVGIGAPFSTRAFTLLGPLRYLFSPAVDVQAGGQPGLAGGGLTEILSAITKWNGAGAMFQYGLGSAGVAARCTTEELGNGRVTITFMDPCQEMSDSGGTLALGGSYYFFGGAGSVDAESFNRASEGFIVTNNSALALEFLTKPGCFEDVQTHELGHVLGLGHSTDPTAIMFPTIDPRCAETASALGVDDVAGITFIYGFRDSDRPEAPSSPPASVDVAVNADHLIVQWTPVAALSASAGGAATAYRVDFRRGLDDGPALASFTTVANSLQVAIPPGLSGDFSVVVTALNTEGGGPPSLRTPFSICGVLPSPVPAISGSVSGGVARLFWQAAAGATSYRAQLGSSQGLADLYPMTDLGSHLGIEFPVTPGFQAWVRLVAVSGCGASTPIDFFLHASP
jgi:hypothetical protein